MPACEDFIRVLCSGEVLWSRTILYTTVEIQIGTDYYRYVDMEYAYIGLCLYTGLCQYTCCLCCTLTVFGDMSLCGSCVQDILMF